ncbi:hypothetical protein [Methylibium rhizosphaerae]|uniref:hypothetical protein n=1 Tax=Methylibium rhizosphaerae TaxID=2570323 RepID=UPI00112B61F1|nr:hypothetical protein [Methylibium rhizosphaerae]
MPAIDVLVFGSNLSCTKPRAHRRDRRRRTASSGRTGLDVQCLPDRAVTAQHFRVTQDGNPLSFFDVDMTTPVVFPQIVSVLETHLLGDRRPAHPDGRLGG